MSEEKLWHKVNPGGKTKEAFERNETPLNLQSPAELAAAFDASRRKALVNEHAEKIPLSNEDIEFVGMVQMFIAEERKELGLSAGYYIPLERVRIFHPDVWAGMGKTSRGQYDFKKDVPQVRQIRSNTLEHFGALSHELRHQASYFETDPADNEFFFRIGCRNLKDGTGNGVDEAVTEECDQQMYGRHLSVLAARFDIDESLHARSKIFMDFGAEPEVYDTYRNVVKAVANQVDGALYEGVPTTWNNLRRLQLDGDMLAYEDIKSVVGDDAFRVLMAMGNRYFFDLDALTNDSKLPSEKSALNVIEVWIERYFANTQKLPEPERQKVLQQIGRFLRESPDQADQTIVDMR